MSGACRDRRGITSSRRKLQIIQFAVGGAWRGGDSGPVLTVQQVDEGRDDPGFGQQGGAGLVPGDGADQDHHLQDQVVLGRT